MKLLGLLAAVLYISFGVGCILASWGWSAAWTVVGLLLFGAWLLVRWRSHRT